MGKILRSLVQKVILEMSVQELETDEDILEMRVQKMSRETMFRSVAGVAQKSERVIISLLLHR